MKKIYIGLLLSMLVAFLLSIAVTNLLARSQAPHYDSEAPAGYIGSNGYARGLVCWYDDAASGSICIDDNGYYGLATTTDASGQDMSISAENVYPFAAAGKTPGNLVLRGGVDSSFISCGAAVCNNPADTVTVSRWIGSSAVAVDVLTYGVSYCVGGCLSNIAMANSLGTAMDALSGVDVLVDDVAAGGIVGIIYPKGTMRILVVDSNVNPNCTIITNGNPANVMVGAANITQDGFGAGVPQLVLNGSIANPTGFGMNWGSALTLIVSGQRRGYFDNNYYQLANQVFGWNVTGNMSGSGPNPSIRRIGDGRIGLGAVATTLVFNVNTDGKLIISNAAETAGQCLDFSADGSLTIYARDCSTMKFYMGSNGSFDQIGYKSSQTTYGKTYQELACAGGGGSATLVTTGNKLCDGCIIEHVGYRVITAGLTGPASMDVGTAAVPDLFCDNCSVADNATSKNSDWTANLPQPLLANDEILFTMNTANCTAGTVRAEIWYRTTTASTVD